MCFALIAYNINKKQYTPKHIPLNYDPHLVLLLVKEVRGQARGEEVRGDMVGAYPSLLAAR